MSDEKTDNAHLKQVIETLLFITDTPLNVPKIALALGEKDQLKVNDLVLELQKEYEERGMTLQIMEIAEGFQMATRASFAPYIRNLYKDRMTMRLSKPALETISIIAYKQPLTRAEVEEIRGVEVIAALETLLEKGLVRVVGRRETVGRPLLYGTTQEFLRHFGLRSLKDLPPIDSFTPPPEVPETMELPLGEAMGTVEPRRPLPEGEASENDAEPRRPLPEGEASENDAESRQPLPEGETAEGAVEPGAESAPSDGDESAPERSEPGEDSLAENEEAGESPTDPEGETAG